MNNIIAHYYTHNNLSTFLSDVFLYIYIKLFKLFKLFKHSELLGLNGDVVSSISPFISDIQYRYDIDFR